MIEQEFEQLQSVYILITEFLVNYSFQLLGAVVILLVGLLLAKKAGSVVLHLLQKKGFDITLSNFLASALRGLIVVMVAIVALGKLGISITPFMAAVGAISLGVGLALQGMLSNYAAGLTIIITRPFVVTNTISVQGVNGVVKEIGLATTVLTNEEGEEITIPNKHIVGEIIHNSFANSLVEGMVGINYDTDPQQAIKLIEDLLANNAKVAKEPEVQLGIDNFGDSSINIGFRYWVPTHEIYQHKFAINLQVLHALREAGIGIPFPQREVRLLGKTAD